MVLGWVMEMVRRSVRALALNYGWEWLMIPVLKAD